MIDMDSSISTWGMIMKNNFTVKLEKLKIIIIHMIDYFYTAFLYCQYRLNIKSSYSKT